MNNIMKYGVISIAVLAGSSQIFATDCSHRGVYFTVGGGATIYRPVMKAKTDKQEIQVKQLAKELTGKVKEIAAQQAQMDTDIAQQARVLSQKFVLILNVIQQQNHVELIAGYPDNAVGQAGSIASLAIGSIPAVVAVGDRINNGAALIRTLLQILNKKDDTWVQEASIKATPAAAPQAIPPEIFATAFEIMIKEGELGAFVNRLGAGAERHYFFPDRSLNEADLDNAAHYCDTRAILPANFQATAVALQNKYTAFGEQKRELVEQYSSVADGSLKAVFCLEDGVTPNPNPDGIATKLENYASGAVQSAAGAIGVQHDTKITKKATGFGFLAGLGVDAGRNGTVVGFRILGEASLGGSCKLTKDPTDTAASKVTAKKEWGAEAALKFGFRINPKMELYMLAGASLDRNCVDLSALQQLDGPLNQLVRIAEVYNKGQTDADKKINLDKITDATGLNKVHHITTIAPTIGIGLQLNLPLRTALVFEAQHTFKHTISTPEKHGTEIEASAMSFRVSLKRYL